MTTPDIFYKIIYRKATILIFKGKESHHPRAGLQLQILGDRATIHSLLGAGFYAMIKVHGWKPFRDIGEDGLNRLNAAVTDAHYDLMVAEIGDRVDIRKDGYVKIHGALMNFIHITEKPCLEPSN